MWNCDRLLVADCRELGLDVRVDAAANVIGTRAGTESGLPAILIGSHLDSVPDGGRYDGPSASSARWRYCASCWIRARRPAIPSRWSRSQARKPHRSAPLRFGSRALAGRLPDVSANRLPDGRTVREALRDAGGDWERLSTVRPELGPIACFVEAHIEQGTRLERANQVMAAVSGFAASTGSASYSTAWRATPERPRWATVMMRFVRPRGSSWPFPLLHQPSRPTIPQPWPRWGAWRSRRTAPTSFPGGATLITDLRSADAALLAALARHVAAEANRAAQADGTSVEISTVLDQMPVTFDPRLRLVMNDVLTRLGGDGREIASLAGHDAVHMQSLAPTGMLFVRCAGGVSHHPAESVTPDDAALAAEALLHIVRAVDASTDFT